MPKCAAASGRLSQQSSMRGGAAGSSAISRRVFFDFISASICRAVFRWALVRGFRDLDLLVQSRMNRIRLFRLFHLQKRPNEIFNRVVAITVRNWRTGEEPKL